MVEPNMFDIYLCDNCDAELYSEEAYSEHEKSCCIVIQDSDEDEEMDDAIEEAMGGDQQSKETRKVNDFMANFGLVSVNNRGSGEGCSRLTSNSAFDILSPEKIKRYSRRARNTITLAKCHGIPFSSPCGLLLMSKVKGMVSVDYQAERLDRNERHCPGPIVDKHNKPKYIKPNFVPQIVGTCTTVTRSGNTRAESLSRDSQGEHYLSYNAPLYFKSRTLHFRNYKFPHRQFNSRSRHENFLFINKPLFKMTKYCEVNLKRLTPVNIEELKKETKRQYEALRQAKKDRIKKLNVVEFIDLCSSDGEEEDPLSRGRPMSGLPLRPSHSVIDGSFLSINRPTSGVKRNILGDRINRMSALAGTQTHSTHTQTSFQAGGTQNQTILRQSSFLFSNTRTNYSETAAVFTVHQENISSTKRSQINNWLQSVEVNNRALVKLT